MNEHRPNVNQSKHVPISDLEPGKRVRSVFLVQSKRSDTTRNGDPYLSLTLGDRTGSVQARVWDNADRYGALFESSDYIFVDALGETYRGDLQLRVQHLEKVSANAVDESQFVKASVFEADEMLGRLEALLADVVTTPALGLILSGLLQDDEIRQGLRRAPAAKVNHHAYLAGLLEHTLSMCELAAAIGKHYERQYGELLRTELLVAGALLHDLGKIWELSAGRTVEYTDVGNLVGHITIGVERLNAVVAELGIKDDDLVLRLKHMILSHHGEPEYGAVVKPKTPEAQVLHFVDQIDSRMNMFAGALGGVEEGWSAWVSPLRRTVYAGPQQPTSDDEGASLPVAEKKPAPPPRSAAPPPPRPRSGAGDQRSSADSSASGAHPAWADDEALINAALLNDPEPAADEEDDSVDPIVPAVAPRETREARSAAVGSSDHDESALADVDEPEDVDQPTSADPEDVVEDEPEAFVDPDISESESAEFAAPASGPLPVVDELAAAELTVDDEPRPVDPPDSGPVIDTFTLDLFGS